MENKIVLDFQRLRMFSGSNIKNNMDGLVEDLSVALEDAACYKKSKSDSGMSYTRRNTRKRKDRRRKTHTQESAVGNMSEASQSSLDEALKDYMENVGQQTDSDDLSVGHHMRLTLPVSGSYVPPVESDSVNENMFSPMRPQRRRKKYKSMAIDPLPGTSQSPVFIKPRYQRSRSKTVSLPKCSMGTSPIDSSGFAQLAKEGSVEETVPGKRKRNTRSTATFSSENAGKLEDGKDDETMDLGSYSHESSTSSAFSSDESDYVYSNDETREADDEQSDFFHEPGPSSGIPSMIPWWENEGGNKCVVTDRQFEQILNGSFEHLPRASQLAFKARMTKIMKHCGREIRFGRRNLKGKIPGYTVSRFIQERHKWNAIQGKFTCRYGTSAGNSYTAYSLMDSKRQRKTPPLPEGEVDDLAESAPVSGNGQQMLQNMGWLPGTGLGPDGKGIKSPIRTHIRPRRQGLGHSSATLSHHPSTSSSFSPTISSQNIASSGAMATREGSVGKESAKS